MNEERPTGESKPHYVYLVAEDARAIRTGTEDIDVGELLATLWARRWVVASFVLVCLLLGLTYAFTATQWYQAEIVLAPSSKKTVSGSLSQLGGLASLAGIDIPAAENGEPLAVLRSKGFASEFIESEGLMPVLYASEWDRAANRWAVPDVDRPDIRDAVRLFDQTIRGVSEDKKTGLVVLTVRWKDPVLAAAWANALVKRLNSRLRARAINEAQSSIDFLQKEMVSTSVLSLQQSIGRVLEGEMQKLTMARSNEEFAFRIVDPATPPKWRQSPKRMLIGIVSIILGALAGVAWVLATTPRLRQGVEQ